MSCRGWAAQGSLSLVRSSGRLVGETRSIDKGLDGFQLRLQVLDRLNGRSDSIGTINDALSKRLGDGDDCRHGVTDRHPHLRVKGGVLIGDKVRHAR